ncbi:MAG: GLUG motif-containing protein [Candidatus Pacearchaeota archaeon]
MKKRGIQNIIFLVLIIFLSILMILIWFSFFNSFLKNIDYKIENSKNIINDVFSNTGSSFNTNEESNIESFNLENIENNIADCFNINLNPIPICTCKDLQNIINKLNGNYVLMNNIDCSFDTGLGGDLYNNGKGFYPIGYDSKFPFTGKFDGRNKKIIGLNINRPNENNIGLFGNVKNSEIFNVSIVDAHIVGLNNVGIIIGNNSYSNIKNCYASGNISGKNNIGGIIGYSNSDNLDGTNIYNCYSRIDIWGNSGIGGLVGNLDSGSISNSYSSGRISGEMRVGGIVGINKNNGYLYNVFSAATPIGSDEENSFGGIVGENYGEIYNSYYSSKDAQYCQGKKIFEEYPKDVPLQDSNEYVFCYKTNLRNFMDYKLDPINEWDFDNIWTININKTLPYFKWLDDTTFSKKISNCFELQNINDNLDDFYYLSDNIDCTYYTQNPSSKGFIPIGDCGFKGLCQESFYYKNPFNGIFNGRGHSIKGIFINQKSSTGGFGLFGYNNGTIYNISLDNVSIQVLTNYETEYLHVGGLVGFNNGIVSDCSIIGKVFGRSRVGGIAGSNFELGIIDSCFFIGNITVINDYGGGIAGLNLGGKINNSYFKGNITGRNYIGGIAGYNGYSNLQKNLDDITIMNSYSNANISGIGGNYGISLGGIVGHLEVGRVINCFSVSKINNYNKNNIYKRGPGYIGGTSYKGKIINCYYKDDENNYPCVNYSIYQDVNKDIDCHINNQNSYYYSNSNPPMNLWDFVNIWNYNQNDYPKLRICIPDCSGKECGNDGCGGTCPPNCKGFVQNGNHDCNEDYKCELKCNEDWDDCDGEIENGCEANLKSETSCGKCGDICSTGKICLNKKCYYPITNCYELQNIKDKKSSDFALMNNIDCSDTINWDFGNGFDPIGSSDKYFDGEFDGRNFNITNLYIRRTGKKFVGVFAYTGKDSVIKNVGFLNLTIADADSGTGGIVGNNSGEIKNSFVINITIDSSTSNKNIGGIAGRNYGKIKRCYVSGGKITGKSDVGGLVGNNFGKIEDSYAIINITANPQEELDDIGGLVGHNNDDANITDCYSKGNITGLKNSNVGGLVGFNNGTIKDSYSTASVQGIENVGGFVGENLKTIFNCFSSSKRVYAVKKSGGFVGKQTSGSINYSYSLSNVSGVSGIANIGGFVGKKESAGDIINSYYPSEIVIISPSPTNTIGSESVNNLKSASFLKSRDWKFPPWIDTGSFPKLDWMT